MQLAPKPSWLAAVLPHDHGVAVIETLKAPMRLFLLLTALVSSAVFAASPRLYVFDCGSITHKTITQYGLKNSDTDVRELFVPCYLIEHGGQRLLWDGGLPLAYAGQPEADFDDNTRVHYAVSLIDQLAAMGLSPSDIDYVAFSHFHLDHNGAANAFVDSHLLIQRTEHDAAFAAENINPIFDPTLYDKLVDAEKTLLDGDHDVFGDGRVVIVSAPGHTPGHQVLYVELADTGRIVLSGDLYHFEASRRLRAVPEFNTDPEQSRRSFDRVESFINEKDATLWIEHSKVLADSLKKAPAYYE
jgi:glyoxylase-like metal-dependent hydrolase (beta-lactamase superfamily II)